MQEGEATAGDDTSPTATTIIATRIRPLRFAKAAAEMSAL
jgi:hypothetical protein